MPQLPILGRSRIPQTFHRVAVVWKHLAHPNVVPLLGVITDPLQLISDWTSGRDLTEYITKKPEVDRLRLVGVSLTALYDELTPSLVV